MGKDDFFVRFGSNADVWARDIEGYLDRVQKRVVTVQRALNGLDKKTAKVTTGAGGPGGGGRPSIPGADSQLNDMVHNLNLASDELRSLVGSVAGTIRLIDALPGRLETSIRSLSSSILAIKQQAEGRGPSVNPLARGARDFQDAGTPGTVRLGSAEEVRTRNMLQAFREAGTKPAPFNRANIAAVTQGQIDKAGADRIIKAIEKQTATLVKRLGNLQVQTGVDSGDSGGGGGTGGGGKKVSKAKIKKDADVAIAAVKQAEVSTEQVTAALSDLMRRIANLDPNDEASAALKAQAAQLQGLQSQMAAEARKAERQATGVSRGQQSSKAQKDFAAQRAAREQITDVEKERRLGQARLVNSPAASNFLEQAGGRGKGSYTQKDLEAMVAAYREAGVIVDRIGVKTKAQLAERLKLASQEYGELHGPGGYKGFATSGNDVAVRKSTKISEELRGLVGDLGDETEAIAKALNVLSTDLKGGGDKIRENLRETTDTVGNINVPDGVVKGRSGRGSGLGPVYTQEDYLQAIETFKTRPERAADSAQAKLRDPSFNPYDRKYDQGIEEGQGDAEKAAARAARKRLLEVRRYVASVDAQAQDYIGLQEALEQGRTRQSYLRKKLINLEKTPASGRDDAFTSEARQVENDLRGVDEELRNTERALAKVPGLIRQLSGDEGYRAGLTTREGGLTSGRTPGTLDEAQRYYSSAGVQEAQGNQQRLLAEVAAAEKAIGEAKAAIGSMNETAAKGGDINMEAYDQAVTKLDRASENLLRFNRELESITKLLETVEGKERVAGTVEGRGARQDYQARVEAGQAARARRTESDFQLFNTAFGERAGGLQKTTAASGSDLIRRYGPAFGFNTKSGEFTPAEGDALRPGQNRLSGKKIAELNAARSALIRALLEEAHARTAEYANDEAKAKAMGEAFVEVEKAANLFAERFARGNYGVAPSFQEMTGHDPQSEEAKAAEELRRQRRDQVRADEARTPIKSNRSTVFAATQDEEAVAGAKRRLAAAQAAQAKTSAAVAEKEAEIEALLQKREGAERSLYAAIEARLARLRDQTRALSNVALSGGGTAYKTGQLAEEAAHRATAARTIGGVDRVAALQHFLGPAGDRGAAPLQRVVAQIEQLGEAAAKAADEAQAAVRAEEAVVREARKTIAQAGRVTETGPPPLEGDLDKAAPAAAQLRARAEAEIRQLQAQRSAILGAGGGAQAQAQLKELYVAREAVKGRIGAARDEGDLKENAGYHAAKEEQGRIEAEIRRLEHELANSGILGEYEKTVTESEKAAGAVARLTTELAEAEKSLKKTGAAWKTRKKELEEERAALVAAGPHKAKDLKQLAGADGTDTEAYAAAHTRAARIAAIDRELSVANSRKQTVATRDLSKAENERVAALRKERAELQALPHTRGERKVAAAAGDQATVEAINARRNRLAAIRTDLEQLGFTSSGGKGGGGAGGGKGGASGTGDVGGASNRNILERILRVLEGIHATIKSGVKVTGRAAGTTAKKAAAAAAAVDPQEELRALQGKLKKLPPAGAPGGSNSLVAGKREEIAARIATLQEQVVRAAIDPVSEAIVDQSGKAAAAKAQGKGSTTAKRTPGTQATAKQAERDAAALRTQIRAQEDLKAAIALVSTETLAEVRAVETAVAAVKAATTDEARYAAQLELTKRQLAAYLAIQRDLAKVQANGNQVRATARTLLTNAQPTLKGGEFDEVARQARSTQSISAATAEAKGQVTKLFGPSGFFSRVINSTGTFIVRNFTAGIVFGLTNALSTIVEQAIKTESTFIRVSSALESTGKDIGNLRSDLEGVSRDYGVALNDVYETASGLANLFGNSKELAGGVRVVAQLQLISDGALSAQEALGVLSSTYSAFQQQAGTTKANALPTGLAGVQEVADVLTSIQNNLNVNIENTGEGVAALAGSANALKLDLQESAVFVAQISKQTNTTGATAGEGLSRIFEGLQTGRGRAAINQALPQAGGALNKGDYGDVLKILIRDWGQLSEAQQANIVTSVAGAKQARYLYALVNDGSRTLDALSRAYDSNGDAAARADKLMATLQGRLKRFDANIQNLALNLVRTGILNFLGLVLVTTNAVVGAINDVLKTFNHVADNNSILGFLRTLTTLLIGAGVAIKLVKFGIGGLRTAFGKKEAEEAAGGITGRIQTISAGRHVSTVVGEEPGPARPPGPFATGYRAPVSRLAAFGVDRSVGVLATGAATLVSKGTTKLTAALAPAEREVGRFRLALATASTKLGERVQGGVAAGRAGLQGVGSRSFAGSSLGFNTLSVLAAAKAQEQLDTLEAQRQHAALTTPAARQQFVGGLQDQGLSTRQIAARIGPVNEGLARSATRFSALSRSMGVMATGAGKLTTAFSNLNRAGALSDIALVGVTTLLIGLYQQHQTMNELRKNYKADFKAEYGSDKGKTQAQIDQDNYISRLASNTTQFSGNQGKSRFDLAQGALLSRFDNGFRGFYDGNYAAARNYGLQQTGQGHSTVFGKAIRALPGGGAFGGLLDKSAFGGLTHTGDTFETYGLSTSNKLLREGTDQINALTKGRTATSAELTKAQADINKQLDDAANKINSDKHISDAQRQQGVANIDAARKQLADMIADPLALADALGSQSVLTTEQIGKLTDALSLAASTAGAQSFGNVDLGSTFQDAITAVGAGKGSEIQKTLRSVLNGSSGIVGSAIKTNKLLQDQVREAQDRYKLDASQTNVPQEQLDADRQQILQLVGQLAQSQQSTIQTIIQNGQDLAALFDNTGNFEAGTHAIQQALRKADQFYREQTRAQRSTVHAFQISQAALAAHASSIDDLPTPTNLPNVRGERNLAGQDRQHKVFMATQVGTAVQREIARETSALEVKDSKTKNPQAKAFIERKIAQITLGILNRVNEGLPIPGVSENAAKKFGNAAVTQDDIKNATTAANQQQLNYAQTQHDTAEQAAQDAASIRTAQTGVAGAYAQARGDAVAAARVEVQAAKIAIALARQEQALATTPQEVAQAKIAMLTAQAQLISANASVSQAQEDLVQSRYQVSIALAEAAGNSVLAAKRTLAAARQALANALKQSGGEATAAVNQARVAAIQAEASLRDAKLQDSLDTIDFNLQMGKITQSSAIAALKQILRTQDLTKAQRRQLLLQIKGMRDQLSDSQFNFGNIKLPTPYQVRRYVTEQRQQAAALAAQAAGLGTGTSVSQQVGGGPRRVDSSSHTTTVHNTFKIDGADTAKVKKIIQEVVGGSSSTNTRTTSARRGR